MPHRTLRTLTLYCLLLSPSASFSDTLSDSSTAKEKSAAPAFESLTQPTPASQGESAPASQVDPVQAPQGELVPFRVSYKTEWKVGWFSIDIDAYRELKRVGGNRWQVTFEAETSAAKLRESSLFQVTPKQRLQPINYQYRATGLFNEDDRTLEFDTANNSIRDAEADKIYPDAWQQEIHDNLTYMLQAGLDLAAGDKTFSYPVFEKNKRKLFRFQVVGEETLNTRAGRLNTIKVQQIRNKKDREIYAWFAKDYHYLLVRLQDKKKGKKRYEINVNDISMSSSSGSPTADTL